MCCMCAIDEHLHVYVHATGQRGTMDIHKAYVPLGTPPPSHLHNIEGCFAVQGSEIGRPH